MAAANISNGDVQSFERLRPRLVAIADPIAPPPDPRSLAVRALAVVDSLAGPEVQSRLAAAEKAGSDLRCVSELGDAAKALLFVVTRQASEGGGEWKDWLARAWTHLASLFEEVCGIRSILDHVPGGFSAATPADVASLEPLRRAPRFNVELEVGIFSESNLYVGFTENMSAAGIFVATHVFRPIGSTIDVTMRFPGQAEPVRLTGEVRWIRDTASSPDASPGMGIAFNELTAEQNALMREFIRKRDPLFFDD